MITLSKLAAEKITDIMREQEAVGAALRVFVRSYGVGTPQVGMALDPSPTDRDETVESEGIRVVVDAESLPFVIGSEIDYVDSMLQSGFTIRNPNLAGGCACGGGGACSCGGH
jgi:iron-sulfur cluster assembly accessory protein